MRRNCASSGQAAESRAGAGGDLDRQIIAEGKIYREILNAAQAIEADLIVIGSHHPERKDYMLGPNAARVVRHVDCSVMVVRE